MEHDIEAICDVMRECGRSIKDIDGNALAYGRKSSVLARNNVARPIA